MEGKIERERKRGRESEGGRGSEGQRERGREVGREITVKGIEYEREKERESVCMCVWGNV